MKKAFFLLLIAIGLDISFQRKKIDEHSHPDYGYWTVMNIAPIFGFATQVILPYKIIFDINNKIIGLLWAYCVVVTTAFRIATQLTKEHYHDTIIAWATINDINSLLIVPFCIWYVITYNDMKRECDTETEDGLEIEYSLLRDPCLFPSRRKRIKMIIILLSTFIFIAIDVIIYTNKVQDDLIWIMSSMKAIMIFVITYVICRIDRIYTIDHEDKVGYVMLYNLMQALLNDYNIITENIIYRVFPIEQNHNQYYRMIYLSIYSVAFIMTIYLVTKLVKKLSNKSVLMFNFYIFDVFMLTSLVVTNSEIDGKFFLVVLSVIIRRFIMLLMDVKNVFARFAICRSHPSESFTIEEQMNFKVINQISSYLCYIVCMEIIIGSYIYPNDYWLGHIEKTPYSLYIRLGICAIYLVMEIINGIILYWVIRYNGISVDKVKDLVWDTFNNYLFYVWVATYFYVIHLVFSWIT
jgi:hypothetical protein